MFYKFLQIKKINFFICVFYTPFLLFILTFYYFERIQFEPSSLKKKLVSGGFFSLKHVSFHVPTVVSMAHSQISKENFRTDLYNCVYNLFISPYLMNTTNKH